LLHDRLLQECLGFCCCCGFVWLWLLPLSTHPRECKHFKASIMCTVEKQLLLHSFSFHFSPPLTLLHLFIHPFPPSCIRWHRQQTHNS
jgi:hypothetical protein